MKNKYLLKDGKQAFDLKGSGIMKRRLIPTVEKTKQIKNHNIEEGQKTKTYLLRAKNDKGDQLDIQQGQNTTTYFLRA